MPRGPYYSNREQEALLNIINDYPKKKYVEMADIAHKYGLCQERSRDALAQQIAKIANPPEEDEVTQVEFDFAESKREEIENKYESLMEAIFSNMKLFDGSVAFKLDYRAILNWIYKNEPDRVNARMDSLLAERYEQQKQG